jgi:hypothetical protein
MTSAATLLLASCSVSAPGPTPIPTSSAHEVHVRFVDGAIDAFVKVGDVLVIDPPGLETRPRIGHFDGGN